MRKHLSFLMLFVYLLASIGFTVKAHYCGGDLASLSLFKKVSCCCESEDHPRKKDDCCKNEIKSFKLVDNQLKEEHQSLIHQLDDIAIDLHVYHTFLFNQWSEQPLLIETSLPKPPDRISVIPPYKRNHSFLFYC